MIVYKSTKESFKSDVETGAVEDVIEAKYNAVLNRGVSANEKRSWQNSMMYMNTVLTDYEIPLDAGITIEMQIPQTSKRIDFIGGIRGLGELKKRVDSGEMKAAFALYPVSMQQLINIADSGNIMPPKTTWFEPKLRSGLVIHKLD